VLLGADLLTELVVVVVVVVIVVVPFCSLSGIGNVASVSNALTTGQQCLNRAQSLLESTNLSVQTMRDSVQLCLWRVNEAEMALNEEKKRRNDVSVERRRLWQIIDPVSGVLRMNIG
jgi:hypothetical protein